MKTKNWYTVQHPNELISPALLVYPERVEKNIETMIAIAGGVTFLRPHVKTYKMAEIIKMQMRHGIYKFKCATIAEAELLAQCGAPDVLLAIQPTGIHIRRFFKLMTTYPETAFATIVDNTEIAIEMATLASQSSKQVSLWVDINNGMNRTGISPDEKAFELYKTMAASPYVHAKGLHVYDGHLRDSDFEIRKAKCDEAFAAVSLLKQQLEEAGMDVPSIVAGGSPSFQIHAMRENVEVSPGTTLLWDQGYANLFPELAFLPAAILITRLISKPSEDILCFDLGHKAVASEMSFPRVELLNIENAKQLSQSEEHMVVACNETEKHNLGAIYYAIPMHVCPTVAKYENVFTVINGEVTGTWKVAARNYKISI